MHFFNGLIESLLIGLTAYQVKRFLNGIIFLERHHHYIFALASRNQNDLAIIINHIQVFSEIITELGIIYNLHKIKYLIKYEFKTFFEVL